MYVAVITRNPVGENETVSIIKGMLWNIYLKQKYDRITKIESSQTNWALFLVLGLEERNSEWMCVFTSNIWSVFILNDSLGNGLFQRSPHLSVVPARPTITSC